MAEYEYSVGECFKRGYQIGVKSYCYGLVELSSFAKLLNPVGFYFTLTAITPGESKLSADHLFALPNLANPNRIYSRMQIEY